MPIQQAFRCRRCREAKNRKSFLIEVEGALTRDYLCAVCRTNFLPMHQLRNRLKNGLISLVDFDIEVAARKKRRAEAAVKNMEHGRMKANALTWNRAIKSAKITLKMLDAMPLTNVEEYKWRKELRQLVQESLEEMEELYLSEQAPNKRALFWYDVSSTAAARARALIAQYPGGVEHSPIQVL